MGYKEEIFQRLERDGFVTVSQIIDWLASDKYDPRSQRMQTKPRDRGSYQKFAEELAEPFSIKEDLDDVDSLDKIAKIKQRVRNIDISNAQSDLNSEISIREEELKTAERIQRELEKEAEEVKSRRR